jgi:transcription antitermination factor NusG
MSISKAVMNAVSKMDRATLSQLQALMNERKDEIGQEVKGQLKRGDYVKVNHKKLYNVTCVITDIRLSRVTVRTKNLGSFNVPISLLTPVKLSAKQIEALQEAEAQAFSKWG